MVRVLSPPATGKLSQIILLTVHICYNCRNYTLHCWVRPHLLCSGTLDQAGIVHEVRSSGDDGCVDERPVWRLLQKKKMTDIEPLKINRMSRRADIYIFTGNVVQDIGIIAIHRPLSLVLHPNCLFVAFRVFPFQIFGHTL